jgi:hypothetical protein
MREAGGERLAMNGVGESSTDAGTVRRQGHIACSEAAVAVNERTNTKTQKRKNAKNQRKREC